MRHGRQPQPILPNDEQLQIGRIWRGGPLGYGGRDMASVE